MKPFLLLSTRPEDDAAAGERDAIIEFAGLSPSDLVQLRVEAEPLPPIRLDDYAGVFLGGGPFNAGDPTKTPLQVRVEADLFRVLGEAVSRDFPLLGLCYGIGTLTHMLGGIVDRTYGEDVGAIAVNLTDAGRADPLFQGVPDELLAFVGHKEACRQLPPGAVLLATGDACPVQAFRMGQRVWATQFHPELDQEGLARRIRIYRDAGYFAPEDTQRLVEYARNTPITPETHLLLGNFVEIARADG